MIATSINQSKKLIELGVDVNTADMYYYNNDEIPQVISDIESLKENINPKFYTLAWSLSALIELMPIKIRNSREFTIYKGESEYSLTYFFHDDDYPIIRDGVTLLDAAFEMVCYLLENKFIKELKL